MGWFSRKGPEAPAPQGPVTKRKGKERIACACGATFASAEKHHAHLHAEHPEHRH
jgi:hypothetical protein